MNYADALKELSMQAAVTGNEKRLADYIKGLFQKHCSQVYIDKFFNVIGIRKGKTGKSKIMITAHMDEIGLMVRSIDDEGFLKITNIGGVDGKILLAQEVLVHGKRELCGVIGAKPPHLISLEDGKKAAMLEDLYIDLGMKANDVRKYISVGDTVTFKTRPFELKRNRLSAKSIDNRVGVAALEGIMERLCKYNHDADVYFVATSQEETGAAGALSAAYNINPDAAVVIDACHGDMPDVPKDDIYSLGKGPAIAVGPNLHKGLTDRLVKISKQENIPYQIDIEAGDSGTEAWVIQVTRCGIPTVLISVPVRYMHTPVETVQVEDVEYSAKLAAVFIREFTDNPGERI